MPPSSVPDALDILKRAKSEQGTNRQTAIPSFLKAFATLDRLDPNERPKSDTIDISIFKDVSLDQMAAFVEGATVLGRFYLDKNDFEKAFSWAAEARLMLESTKWRKSPVFEWVEDYSTPELAIAAISVLGLLSEVNLAPANTAAAAWCGWRAQKVSEQARALLLQENNSALRSAINKTIQWTPAQSLRHPDPSLMGKILHINDEKLQIRGSWMKMKNSGKMSKTDYAHFVHEGRLYVVGGKKEPGDWDASGEMLSLDLENFDRWRKEPDCPIQSCFGYRITLHRNKAWLITGGKRVHYFDLASKKWDTLLTSFKPSRTDRDAGVVDWPWSYNARQGLRSATVQSANGKLYVFGGYHNSSHMGTNLFMELDLDTKTWKRLAGKADCSPDYSGPSPRVFPCSWINKDETKFFVAFGSIDRPAGMLDKPRHPAFALDGHTPWDFWSWEFSTQTWTRERWTGNCPSPRSENSCVYNPVLDKVFAWGGYNPDLPSDLPNSSGFAFSYFADTFVYGSVDDSSSSPSSWRHVLTRGFPTPRAQGELIVDPDTGKTFLFGGYTNADFLPQCDQKILKSFGDVWQLRVDMTGGFFEGVNDEEEKRTARMGPWKRCFNCNDMSAEFKKCGGSCEGKAHFCSNECLKDGWPDHKQMHHCKKKK
ncbi:hypothetical protein DL96DRAFT_1617564 [Flagelloscypha sp. PMI_526]|nr:hypothetical protein DL96DRAFT_1617564 [Flagelloscypha sp. PMI_526]